MVADTASTKRGPGEGRAKEGGWRIANKTPLLRPLPAEDRDVTIWTKRPGSYASTGALRKAYGPVPALQADSGLDRIFADA